MGAWRFRPYQEGEMKVDPIENQFFTTNEVGNISNAIVREGIQNALDETVDGAVTSIRIFLSGVKYAVESERAIPFFIKLIDHIETTGSGIRSVPDFKADMKFLLFEDFNTKGLEGDIDESKDVDTQRKDLKHNFFWFWRNVGRSGKSDEKLGRWGLGKTVFPASSQINSFWGLTIRESDPSREFLMGQSILRSHNLENDQKDYGFTPYGFYGDYKKENFASPVEDKSTIKSFKETFKLNRQNQSGLSIIIPYVNEEITFERLIYSTIEQYFFPIITGGLNVKIEFEDQAIDLTKSTIRKAIDDFDFTIIINEDNLRIKNKESFSKLFDFAEYINGVKAEEFISLNEPSKNGVPLWLKGLFDSDVFLGLQDKFENGERIAFKIPLKYQPKGEAAEIRWYKAFIEKDTSLDRPENHFIRKGITITGVNSLKSPGARGIVLIDDEKLTTMIGDAENPAHTEIQKDSRNFKDKYIDGDKCLTFLEKTLQKIFDELQKPAIGLEKDLLGDYFFIPEQAEEETEPIPDDDSEGETNKEDRPDIRGRPSKTLITKLSNGFKILKNPRSESTKDSLFEVQLGYRTSRGDSISKYEKLDFDLNEPPIKINFSGVTILNSMENTVNFKVNNDNFDLEVNGFDPKRDLVIKLKEQPHD